MIVEEAGIGKGYGYQIFVKERFGSEIKRRYNVLMVTAGRGFNSVARESFYFLAVGD